MKLTKAQEKDRAALIETLNDVAEKLRQGVDTFNAEVERLWDEHIEGALEAYNTAITTAQEFANDIAGDIQSAIDDKSEKWQEGDRGQAVIEMQSEWEGVSLDEVEIEKPSEIDEPELSHAETLEALPIEPSL